MFQLLLEYDDLSWQERDWFSVYSPNSSANLPQSEVNIQKVLPVLIQSGFVGTEERIRKIRKRKGEEEAEEED